MFGEIVAIWFGLAVVMFALTILLTLVNRQFNFYKYGIAVYIILAVIVWYVVPMTYFFYKTPILAEKGIIFKDRINLDKHIKIGDGVNILYDYDIYTRSDRSKETIIVYKK
jgi:hypothetical protein